MNLNFRPLHQPDDLDPIIEEIGNKKVVMIGEASHGTCEFYTWRAKLTRRLIEEKGFSFVSVEGDWPACYEVNRYVKSYPNTPKDSVNVLQCFDRWPAWMWSNWEVSAFIRWLRRYNLERQEGQEAVGFYGLDVYSLWESMQSVMDYLKKNAPAALPAAEKAWKCFEPCHEDPQYYALGTTAFVPKTCEKDVLNLLRAVREQVPVYDSDPEGRLSVEQNAQVVVGAEKYYRTMVRSDAGSWNTRDSHMMETFDRLMRHHGDNAKGIVWAHNTHVGDALYTSMRRAGEFNIGQLGREQYGERNVYLIGFGSYQGSVVAGSRWGAPLEKMMVPQGKPGSWEDVIHQSANGKDVILLSSELQDNPQAEEKRGHRAIGVVYHPVMDFGNYVPTILPRRYDAFMYIDKTMALHPLNDEPGRMTSEPDTYPWGF